MWVDEAGALVSDATTSLPEAVMSGVFPEPECSFSLSYGEEGSDMFLDALRLTWELESAWSSPVRPPVGAFDRFRSNSNSSAPNSGMAEVEVALGLPIWFGSSVSKASTLRRRSEDLRRSCFLEEVGSRPFRSVLEVLGRNLPIILEKNALVLEGLAEMREVSGLASVEATGGGEVRAKRVGTGGIELMDEEAVVEGGVVPATSSLLEEAEEVSWVPERTEEGEELVSESESASERT